MAGAATYHVDPAAGSMSNPGTASQPWSTLEAVFTANKTFSAGDVILLRSGYHGAPAIKGNNSADVTIRPDTGANPKIKNLIVRSGSRWVIEGLDICPENQAPGASFSGDLVSIESSASRITLRDSTVRSAFSTANWTLEDWKSIPERGIRTAGAYTTLSNNRIETSSFAITVRKTAPFSLVSRNVVTGFTHDGIQALADDCVFETNTVTDAYISDNDHNHDDFFQSWSVADGGTVAGEGTVYRVTLRGNTFISHTNPTQPFAADPQGIGCFDGYYEGWVIENNIIASKTSHGIALYGAIECKVVNNTVVENPFDTPGGSTRPWIKIAAHKTRTTAPTGNLVRNNISAKPVDAFAGSSTVDFHQTTTAYSTYFVSPSAFNYSLKSTAPAKDAGSTSQAPPLDITGTARSAPYDLGAHEYAGVTGSTYTQWLQANGLPVDGRGQGDPTEDPRGDGVSNEMKFALGLPGSSSRYGGRFITGTMTASGSRYLSLTFTYPDPAPAGVTYEVQSARELSGWTSTTTVEVSNTVTGGLRTRVFRDTVPIGAGQPRRFIRLVAEAP